MRLTTVVVFCRRFVASLCATEDRHASGSRQTVRADEPVLPQRCWYSHPSSSTHSPFWPASLRVVSEHSPFVDYYYGPPAWKAQIATEPLPLAPALLRQALDLAEVISRLELSPQRMTFLRKQVLAMQTICQKLCGETFTLEEPSPRNPPHSLRPT
jgi:hypothetical protein